MSAPKLAEIAERLDAHLKRMERDPIVNARREYDRERRTWIVTNDPMRGTGEFYNAHASRAGAFVRLCFVRYQHTSNITKAQALEYLTWLDAGNNGTIYAMRRARER